MRTFSIALPNDLATSSQKTAQAIGLTRAEFIRMAIRHELQRVHRQNALEAMAESLQAMGKNEQYLQESEELDQGLTPLPEDKDAWWLNH